MSDVRIGIDFGGTKIEAAALDGDGEFEMRLRAANPGNYDNAIRTVVDLVAAIESRLDIRASVGVGAPGSVSPTTGTMRNANSVYLNGRRFVEDLGQALRREVRVANDANCFALSEVVDGAAAGSSVAFGAILGTSYGGGLVIDGRLVAGANGIAGEWGHIPLPWPTHEEIDASGGSGAAGRVAWRPGSQEPDSRGTLFAPAAPRSRLRQLSSPRRPAILWRVPCSIDT